MWHHQLLLKRNNDEHINIFAIFDCNHCNLAHIPMPIEKFCAQFHTNLFLPTISAKEEVTVSAGVFLSKRIVTTQI